MAASGSSRSWITICRRVEVENPLGREIAQEGETAPSQALAQLAQRRLRDALGDRCIVGPHRSTHHRGGTLGARPVQRRQEAPFCLRDVGQLGTDLGRSCLPAVEVADRCRVRPAERAPNRLPILAHAGAGSRRRVPAEGRAGYATAFGGSRQPAPIRATSGRNWLAQLVLAAGHPLPSAWFSDANGSIVFSDARDRSAGRQLLLGKQFGILEFEVFEDARQSESGGSATPRSARASLARRRCWRPRPTADLPIVVATMRAATSPFSLARPVATSTLDFGHEGSN